MWIRRLRKGQARVLIVLALVATVAGSAHAASARRNSGGAGTRNLAAAAAAVLPSGFTDKLVTTLPNPIGLAFTPDGRLLATTQAGQLRVIANDALVPTPALDLSSKICTERERGMPGVAVDPAFAQNHFIYVFYTFKKFGVCDFNTAQSPVNRVSRFVLSDSNTVDPATELVLLDNIPAPEGAWHTTAET
jgi:glucose/arabinose dehydrogenase